MSEGERVEEEEKEGGRERLGRDKKGKRKEQLASPVRPSVVRRRRRRPTGAFMHSSVRGPSGLGHNLGKNSTGGGDFHSVVSNPRPPSTRVIATSGLELHMAVAASAV